MSIQPPLLMALANHKVQVHNVVHWYTRIVFVLVFLQVSFHATCMMQAIDTTGCEVSHFDDINN